MTAAEIIDQVLAAGGRIAVDGADLVLTAPRPLPADLLDRLRAHKPDILAALACPGGIALWGRVAITEPGDRTVEVDSPSGWILPDWQAYAERYHGPGCAVNVIAGLPKARAPVNLDEAIRAACERLGGITPEVCRSLLSPEDVADIEAGDIHPKTLKAYALSFVNHGGAGEANYTRTSPHGRAGLRDIPDDAFLFVNPVLMAGVKNELGRLMRAGSGKLNL